MWSKWWIRPSRVHLFILVIARNRLHLPPMDSIVLALDGRGVVGFSEPEGESEHPN